MGSIVTRSDMYSLMGSVINTSYKLAPVLIDANTLHTQHISYYGTLVITAH